MASLRFLALFAAVAAVPQLGLATVVWDQGFESDTSGWFDDSNGWTGSATRVASGTGGITSKTGGFHAVFEQNSNGGSLSAPFSRFDGYRTVWPGGFTASIDIYLDTSWAAGAGFDYSVAVNGSDGNHQRDFIFHVTQDTSTGSLLVGGSNNTNFAPREDLETLNNYEVTASGWYTFEHDFRDAGDGTLAVDLNLRDDSGTLLFTETRNDGSDVIATEIGGNRYAWFTTVTVTNGIDLDNHSLSVVPEPFGIGFFGTLFGAAYYARRR
ncbi:MAG: hypothetical protein AAF266_15105 [Planctomycetota bacterium]